MACPVRSAAAHVRWAGGPAPNSVGHAAEGPLIDAPVLGARERHAVVLELVDGIRRMPAEIFDGVLVAEPVGPLTVSYMCQRQLSGPMLPSEAATPPWAATVCERVGNTLVMHAVLRPASAAPSVRAQTRAARADDDHVIGVIDDRIRLRRSRPAPRRLFLAVGLGCHRALASKESFRIASALPAPTTIAKECVERREGMILSALAVRCSPR